MMKKTSESVRLMISNSNTEGNISDEESNEFEPMLTTTASSSTSTPVPTRIQTDDETTTPASSTSINSTSIQRRRTRESSRKKKRSTNSNLSPRSQHQYNNVSNNSISSSSLSSASKSKKISNRMSNVNSDNTSNCFESTTNNISNMLMSSSSTITATTTNSSNQIESKRSLSERIFGGNLWKGTVHVVNFLARVVLWGSIAAMAAGCIWYSRELAINGTDPHLIAWFSAGAFVLLGFPISMYGIFMHLTNYYQPNVQCYVVRILWMVPIYSIESWLCLRFHEFAIYIETLRDCYESFVLYCFLHYLIEVLGGEEELTLMLKDKSPTRGVHISPMNWCMRPWIMGQPITRLSASYVPLDHNHSPDNTKSTSKYSNPLSNSTIQWRSPFYIKCKIGVLQYVLIKILCSVVAMILELNDCYNEGDFNPRTGYLYICIITNTSQCWALYCLVFFYTATKNELSPIRPVGKFLSVKAIVFFTWWQSIFISILYQMNLIPDYNAQRPWSAEAVAKGLQDYIICIEMFIGAIVHVFVFPHTDYISGSLASSKSSDLAKGSHHQHKLGKKHKKFHHQYANRRKSNRSPSPTPKEFQVEVLTCDEAIQSLPGTPISTFSVNENDDDDKINEEHVPLNSRVSSFTDITELEDIGLTQEDEVHDSEEENENELSAVEEESSPIPIQQPIAQKAGFVRAFLDSAMPRDVVDNTVGMVKGQFKVEKKTLLHHATTSDEYDLFSKRRRMRERIVHKSCENDTKDKDITVV